MINDLTNEGDDVEHEALVDPVDLALSFARTALAEGDFGRCVCWLNEAIELLKENQGQDA